MKKSVTRHLVFTLCIAATLNTEAQVGEYRNTLSIGVNGGYMLNRMDFMPKVNQSLHGGLTGGFSVRYTCEKYFNTICSLGAELNYAQLGWKENILDENDEHVINPTTQMPEEFSRTINYVQLPLFAHLAWGSEEKGFKFFIQAGPQIGFYLSDNVKKNFDIEQRNRNDRVNNTVEQDTMTIENKFDYGISAGAGVEYSHPRMGHFILEGRYYYGLGNIYGDSKRDFFGRSSHGTIIVKISYLFDIIKKN